MERRTVNPWSWQDNFGFSQAIEVSGAQRTMRGQINQAMDNLETVLRESGAELSNVVRLNYYTTDVDLLLEAYDVLVGRLAEAGCQPTSTLLGVTSLAFPELLVEIEATAVA